MKILNDLYVKRIFEESLREAGYGENTILCKLSYIDVFFDYLRESEEVTDFRDTGCDEVMRYLKYLDTVLSSRTGKAYSYSTKIGLFGSIKLLFKMLYLKEKILVNPLQDFKYRPHGIKKTKEMLSKEEIACILDSIDITELLGLRDRAIFELLYSSGLRVSEVVNLNIDDVDFTSRMILIQQGKWSKDRICPVSKVAIKFLQMYLYGNLKETGPVFKGRLGRLGSSCINRRFKKYLDKCGIIRRDLSVHSIRHSTATHLLSGGAGLRFVQELLGHESIETTVIYTDELHDNMKKIYRSYHPRENGLFREVDSTYLEQLYSLKSELIVQKPITDKKRYMKKRWYENRKRRINV